MAHPVFSVGRAVVIGAGTMGAGIAAHLANAGVRVDLLDIVPQALTQAEEDLGLELSDPRVRNRIAESGWRRARASRPASEIAPGAAARVSIGNLEDDLDRLGLADWIVEAVVEDLSIKRQIMERIEMARRPGSLVSTNTSGLPLRDIAEGRSEEFCRHFLGTHFFNPPLTMKLVEIIPGPLTDHTLVVSIANFVERRLDKGVVLCKDTPNFIANRVASVQSSFDMDYILTHDYTVEEADAILGPLVGRPSTATFRLRDLVGLDVSTHVAENLYRAIPHDSFREVLMRPRLRALRRRMIERGLLGRKTGAGFYRAVESPAGRRFFPLDLNTLEHTEPRALDLPSLSQAGEIDSLPERLRFLVSKKDRVGNLVWASLSNVMTYAAYCLPEIADQVHPVDRALRWGYSWKLGPFEIWDALGVSSTLSRLRHDGMPVASWVAEMVRAGHESFYKSIDGLSLAYSPMEQDYIPLEPAR